MQNIVAKKKRSEYTKNETLNVLNTGNKIYKLILLTKGKSQPVVKY